MAIAVLGGKTGESLTPYHMMGIYWQGLDLLGSALTDLWSGKSSTILLAHPN